METATERFEIDDATAEAYEAAFVPAFFAQWVPALLDVGGVRRGRRVLDVACGTGVVARQAADRAGEDAVTGLDRNAAMLAVARRVRPGITWTRGDAADLPFPTGSFDAVLCQMALMFFPDPARAIREMARVAAPGATVAVGVPAELAAQEAFAPFVAMAARHVGQEAAGLLTTYFAAGDRDRLVGHLEAAGLRVVSAGTEIGRYRFPSVDAAVTTEVESTPLHRRIDAPTYRRIRADAHDLWRPFITASGALDAPFATHLVAARKPAP